MLSIGGLRGKIQAYSRKHQLLEQQVQKLVAIAIIEKLLPKETIIKGGNSLTLRFPIKETRYSQDLDLMVTTSENEWRKDFENNLARGIDGFTGWLSDRGNLNPHHHLKNSLAGFEMWPIDIHLLYQDKAFSKIPLDVTPRLTDQRKPVDQPLSDDMKELLAYIGIENSEQVTFENPVDQIIDKAATMYFTSLRPHDIKDLTILVPQLLRGGILSDEIARGIIDNLNQRQSTQTLSAERAEEIAHNYEEQGYGPKDQALLIIHNIDKVVQKERCHNLRADNVD